MGIARSFDVFFRPSLWLQPLSTFWYLPALNFAMSLLYVAPYPSTLLRGRVRFIFLAGILFLTGFSLRYALLPVHYASPELAQHPAEFEAAKSRPSGDGFRSERTEQGKTHWVVKKPNYGAIEIVIAVGIPLIPLMLFSIRRYEVRRGITWRNFLSPPSSVPPAAGDADVAQSSPPL